MTKRYENREFDDITDRNRTKFEDIELVRCQLDINLSAKNNDGNRYRTIVRNCKFKDITVLGDPRSAIFEDIEIDGLRVSPRYGDSLTFDGSLFRHVTLKGKVAGPELRFLGLSSTDYNDDKIKELEAFESEYYANTDWALDISEAKFFNSPELEVIPGHLIIRDPETQVLITKERVKDFDHTKIELGASGWEYSLFWFKTYSKHDSFVLAAATQGPRRHQDLKAIETLREMGVAVPEDRITMPKRSKQQ